MSTFIEATTIAQSVMHLSDIGDFHRLCVGFGVFWVGSLHMGGGALFAAKPGYAQPLGALG